MQKPVCQRLHTGFLLQPLSWSLLLASQASLTCQSCGRNKKALRNHRSLPVTATAQPLPFGLAQLKRIIGHCNCPVTATAQPLTLPIESRNATHQGYCLCQKPRDLQMGRIHQLASIPKLSPNSEAYPEADSEIQPLSLVRGTLQDAHSS